ncbi:MAG: glycoside hydrolase family 88 protein [Bacteroidota bacterium]|nr:glycoside hydrolase family 88 protein [Bacteroidota bacterium]
MRHFKKYLTLLVLAGISGSLFAQQKNKSDLLSTIDDALQKAVAQYQYLATTLPADSLPRTYYPLTKKSAFSESGWWTSGFYPGSLLYLYTYSHNPVLQTEAEKKEALLEKEQFNKGTHDLGFMMYCSFGNSEKIHPSEKNETILMNSARSLSTRFNPKIGCIQSWNASKKWKFPVIIDNMMNLELLFWATKHSGDSSFYKIAVSHANTTMKNHFRADNSSWHVVNYDPETGQVISKQTAQGYADYSAWSRGQAWGLYGFTVMYRATHDRKYLVQAEKIARYIMTNPNLPADKIPYWDYNSPDIPATYRDASAAAITASALIELSGYTDAIHKTNYLKFSEDILHALAGPAYTAPVGQNGGFILKHSTGALPMSSEVDVPLTYADYYYIEAMLRYKALKGK